MASQQGKGKKARKPKTSRGLRRSSLPVHLTEVQKMLMGKGLGDSIEHVPCKSPWRGATESRAR